MTDHGLGQLESHSPAGQITERIAVIQSGMDNRQSFGQLLGNKMMVGNDNLQAKRACQFNFRPVADAAVNRYNQPRALVGQVFNNLLVKPVTLFFPVRQISFKIKADFFEGLEENAGTANAVSVIIAVNNDHY